MKYFIILIYIKTSFFIFSAEADFLFNETSSQLDHSKKAIWKIQDPSGERTNGTAFFIGTNYVITNFHVFTALYENNPQDYRFGNQKTIDYMVLVQEDNPTVLKIKRVLALSALYDLVLLETEESVTSYLQLREDPPKLDETLFLMAYPNGDFTKIRKIGDVVYEDEQISDFLVNHSPLEGTSGGPVLDEQGLTVGVAFANYHNVSRMIKLNYLKEFIARNIGLRCFRFNSARACMEEEMRNLKLAAKDSIYAKYELADRYYEGEGVEQDFSKAFQLFKQLVEWGYVPAHYRLAKMYYKGEGINHNLEQAFYWNEKGVERGYVLSRYTLAFSYYDGKGVEQDFNNAFQLFEQLAKRGYAPAQYMLALMYHEGKGVEQNVEKAIEWYERAVELGYAPAQYMLALMYHEGEGVEQDTEKALQLMKEATYQGHFPAFLFLLVERMGGIPENQVPLILKMIDRIDKNN